MYENDYMYAIERNDDYLAHYGIRGMKWGVRKAIASGNSRALGRQYRKAQKKLAKLEKRAASGKKYAKRAALLGAGAAAAGGLAAAGTAGIGSAMTKIGAHGGSAMIGAGRGIRTAGAGLSKNAYILGSALQKTGHTGAGSALKKFGAHGGNAMVSAGNAISKGGQGMSRGMYGASKAVRTWGNSNSISNAMINANGKGIVALGNKGVGAKALGKANKHLAGVSNNTIARIGAGVIGAGLAGAAGYNAYRAATTKRAAKKAAQFRKAMNESFKGTQYANGGAPRQGKKRRRR